MNTVEDIFKRLTEVQIEMEHLLSETNALHESLNDLLENENLQEIKPKKDVLKKQINELGYEIVTSTKQHSRHWICKNHSKTINIMVKESKYFNEADYTSWYTVNEGVEEFIDYFFFLFIDLNGETHWIYINKSNFKKLLQNITPMPDGRKNIRLNYDNKQVKEIQTGMDLSEDLDKLIL